jgi:hypothetical protein
VQVIEQLKPFQSNDFCTCPKEYLLFKDEEDEYRERYLTGGFGRATGEYTEHAGESFRDVFATFDNYMEEFYGPRDEKTGRYGEWFNPNSQYDWYVYGGRFSGHLILKPDRDALSEGPDEADADAGPERANRARKGDIDFEAMSRERYQGYLASWEELEREGKTADRSAKWIHNIPESVTTREQFLAYARWRSAHNAPAAVVVDGEWFGPWWVEDGPTEEAALQWDVWFAFLLASLPDDTLLTVIDCHV